MERRRFHVVCLISLALFGAIAWPMVSGRIYVADDLANYGLPLRGFYADCLAARESFAWCPRVVCGIDLHAEGQVGMLHPWHLLLYGLLPLTVAFNVEILANYVLMFAGMSLFLRRWGLPRDAAWFGALVFAFSGFSLLRIMHLNFLTTVAHLPWLLLAIDAIIRAPDPRRAAWPGLALALLTASELLLGFPQAIWILFVAEVVYAVGLLLTLDGTGRRWRVVILLRAKLLGLLIGCVQLIPTWEALGRTARGSPSPAFLAYGSLHPANLAQLVAPYLFRDRIYTAEPPGRIATHELGMYAGAVVPVLIAWLVVRRRDLGPFRPLALLAALLGVVGLLLAFGSHGPLFSLLIRLPLVGGFRVSSRSIGLVHFATALLAAIALADLGRLVERPPWRALWPLAVPGLASVAVVVGALGLASGRLASIDLILVGPALIGVASALVIAAARGMRGALVSLVLFAAVDQAAYGLSYIWRTPPTTLAALLATHPVPPDAIGRRVVVEEGNDLWIMNGVDLVNGYLSLMPVRRPFEHDRANQRVAGAAWIWKEEKKDGPGRWEPLPDPLPRARLVTRALPRSSVSDLMPSELATTAAIPFGVSLALTDGPPGEATILDDRPGRVRVATDAPTRQLLVLADRHDEGWRVRVDGSPRPLIRVNGCFMGCVVEAGRHVAEFRFEPASHRLGAWVGALGVIGTLAAWGLDRRRSNRDESSDTVQGDCKASLIVPSHPPPQPSPTRGEGVII